MNKEKAKKTHFLYHNKPLGCKLSCAGAEHKGNPQVFAMLWSSGMPRICRDAGCLAQFSSHDGPWKVRGTKALEKANIKSFPSDPWLMIVVITYNKN